MTQPPRFSAAGDDTVWAVLAIVGRIERVAEIHSNRRAALDDRAWREHQVMAYRALLDRARQPAPRYSVAPMKRADLPRGWRPLPALGILYGRFI
ncbi:MAG: hypothetical protein WCC64_19770 [Aliidongia sp.]